ncbi:MAG: hypothetical protein R2822_28985 [Spirosomataceae bacterium]
MIGSVLFIFGDTNQRKLLESQEFMQLEGYAYRLLPVQVPGATDGYVNTEIMANNPNEKTFLART